MNSPPILRVDDLWIHVRERGLAESRAVVRGANLEISRGATTCIVGQSGAGKTLLMRSVIGITAASPGITRGRLTFGLQGRSSHRGAPADEAGATTEFGDPDQCVGR